MIEQGSITRLPILKAHPNRVFFMPAMGIALWRWKR